MAVNREAIFAALFARMEARTNADLTAASGATFRYATRLQEGWDEEAPSQCPAWQLRRGPETRRQSLGAPPIVAMSAAIVIYCQQDQARSTPAQIQINELLTVAETMLERQPSDGPAPAAIFPNNPSYNYGTTLGGLCFSCQIAGTIETFEGITGEDAVAIIPVEILTTP